MEIRNRKLFPALSSTNQTACPDFCDPACPYNCPDFYFLPPPPPLPASPPPPPPPPAPRATTYHNKGIHVSLSLVITLSSAAVLIMVLFYVIVTKSSIFRRPRNDSEAASLDGSDEDILDENHVDHPIWFITTIGLQQSIINSITVCKYRKSEGLIEGTECSVCLNEFQDGETVRLLPKCSHAFHIPCIDTWLRSHTNCPLCRANIVSDPGNSNASAPPPMPPGELAVQQDPDSESREDLQQQDLMANGEMGSDQNVNLVVPRDDVDEILEDEDEGVSKEGLDQPHENPEMKIVGDSDDNHMASEEEVKPISNSVLIDSLSASTSRACSFLANFHPEHASKDMEDHKAEDDREVASKKTNCSSVQEFPDRNPVLITRSHSCSSGFFLSRHSRSMNPILPY